MVTIATFLLGLALRIGIPIGITVLVFVLLRQLDKRWQKDAMSVPVVATGGKPCWELKGCSEDNKKNARRLLNRRSRVGRFSAPGMESWERIASDAMSSGKRQSRCGCEKYE